MKFQTVKRSNNHPIFNLLEDSVLFSVTYNDVHVKFAETEQACIDYIASQNQNTKQAQ